MEFEPTFPHWLLLAVLIGFFGGAITLGTFAGLSTPSDSLFFDPGGAAFFGAFLGAFGRATLGFLVWATAALAVLIRRAANRLSAG